MSHFPRFSFFSPYSRSYIGHSSFSTLMNGSCHIPVQTVFLCHFQFFISSFSPRSMSYHVIFSCPELFSFLAIFQILQSAFFIFHIFQCFSPFSTSYHVCVSFSTFFSFLPIIQTYSAHFSFFTLFSVSRHIPGYTMFVTHFPRFFFFVCFLPHSRS